MSVNEKNIIDFKTALVKDEAPVFSSGLYSCCLLYTSDAADD